MRNSNLIQIIVILLMVAGPALAAIWKKLEEKRQAHLRDLERQRRQEEALRTGRDPDMEDAATNRKEAAEALAELAAQRQAQLQELRRRQQERLRQAGGAATASTSAPPASRPGAPMPVPARSAPSRPAPRPPVARPTPAPQRRATPAPPPQAAPRRPAQRPPQQRRRPPVPTPVPVDDDVRRVVSDAPRDFERPQLGTLKQQDPTPSSVAPARSTMKGTVLGQAMTADDWRRAIIFREILDVPISLRHEGEPL